MPATGQAWSRVTIPVSGHAHEATALDIAARIAEAFEAELNVLFAPADPAELSPWLGEGFMGTVQMSTLDTLKAASEESELAARAQFATVGFAKKVFSALESPVWQDLAEDDDVGQSRLFGKVLPNRRFQGGKNLLGKADRRELRARGQFGLFGCGLQRIERRHLDRAHEALA